MMRKKKDYQSIFYILFTLLVLYLLSPELSSIAKEEPVKPNKKLVVIDAGHGGKDTGASGVSGLTEKGITLKLALILRDMLIKKPNLNVLLTRTENIDIAPEKRVSLANSKSADIFLSLHVNGSFDPAQKGIEIYYYSEENLELFLQASPGQTLSPKAESEETSTLISTWNEAQNAFIPKSLKLAKILDDNLRKLQDLEVRGIRPAPLYVLTGTTMPSLVIEAGFVTNTAEKSALARDEYLKAIASKIADGIGEYFEE